MKGDITKLYTEEEWHEWWLSRVIKTKYAHINCFFCCTFNTLTRFNCEQCFGMDIVVDILDIDVACRKAFPNTSDRYFAALDRIQGANWA